MSPCGWEHCSNTPCTARLGTGGLDSIQCPSTLCGKNFLLISNLNISCLSFIPLPWVLSLAMRVKISVPALSCSSGASLDIPKEAAKIRESLQPPLDALWQLYTFVCNPKSSVAPHRHSLKALVAEQRSPQEPAAPPAWCHQPPCQWCTQIVGKCVKAKLGSVWSDWGTQLSSVSTQVIAENFAFKFALSTRGDLKETLGFIKV